MWSYAGNHCLGKIYCVLYTNAMMCLLTQNPSANGALSK